MEKWRADLRARVFGAKSENLFAKPVANPLTEAAPAKIRLTEAPKSVPGSPYKWKPSSLAVEGDSSPFKFDWGSRVVQAKRDKTENVLLKQHRKDLLEAKTNQEVSKNLESQPKFCIL